MTNCLYCNHPLIFSHRHTNPGWVHQDPTGRQGSCYLMACKDCGTKAAFYPSPTTCPACNSSNWHDLHAATPAYR